MNMAFHDIELSDADFARLRAFIHQKTGITIGEARKSMLVSRLRGRLREVGATSFTSYISKATNDPDEAQELINRVTTNETYFYRTPRVWSYFRENCVRDFLNKSTASQMRIWSAAASTGEEAHTVGVVLEDVRTRNTGFDYSVLGTDVSARVLAVAEDGLYKGKAIQRFQKEDPALFQTYLHGTPDDGYRVDKSIKSRLKFRLHNLMEPLKNERPFDVVFLRNVLIYFSLEDQQKVLRHVHDHLKPDGVLFIGESETLSQIETDFDSIAPLIYRPVPRSAG